MLRRSVGRQAPAYEIVENGVSRDLTGTAEKSVAGVSVTSFTASLDNVNSKLIVPRNSYRKSLLIQNLSGDTIYVNTGSPASASPISGVAIFTGGNWEPPFTPGDAIWAIGTVATEQQVAVMVGT